MANSCLLLKGLHGFQAYRVVIGCEAISIQSGLDMDDAVKSVVNTRNFSPINARLLTTDDS